MRAVPFAFALLAVSIGAQDPAWRLPARGAAEYRRELNAGSDTAPSRAEAQQLAATGKVPKDLLPELVMPAWLCQGELTADQRAVGDEPRDLRDLMRAVAFDLTLRGPTKRRYVRLLPFGDLLLTGRVAAADATGHQAFTLEVATDAPEVRPGEPKAELNRYIRPLCKRDATGTLQIERTFDATAGVVRSFAARLELVWAGDKGRFRKLAVSDRWDLVEVHDNQDPAFRAAVDRAIVAGTGWLRGELGDLGRGHLRDQEERDRSYGSGRIALGLLTLLHADVPGDDTLVVAGFDELDRRDVTDTYSLGVALMALAARYAPPGEIEALRLGRIQAPQPRQLSERDRDLATRWLTRLLQNVDTRSDPAYRLRFNYVPAPRFDNSVHQYGLLGMFAARICQLEVPSVLWRAAAAHLLEVQGDDSGRRVRLSLTTHRELAQGDDTPQRTRGTGAQVPTRGFAYQEPDHPVYGSMTAAGIAGLVIARAGMVSAGQAKADVMPKIDAAIQQGFGWLAAEFHVRSNPGFVDKADKNVFYFLYGLERACELVGIALLQDRDWYYEGALQILGLQKPDGSFPLDHPGGREIDTTCFAILFLKKATAPAVTGG